MTKPADLEYQTTLMVAGQAFHCVESYEAVLRRMAAARQKVEIGENEQMSGLSLPQMLELTTRGHDDRPLRTAFAVVHVSWISETPEEHRVEVVMP